MSDHDAQLIIPPALAAEIRAVAEEEHRPAVDVVRAAVDSYRREQRWRKTLAYGAERARSLGLAETDIPQLIAEYRQEKRQAPNAE